MRIEAFKNDISLVNTVLQEPNLMYNGVYLHNNYGAESEAKEIFEKVENKTSSMHVIFGMGLGYLLQVAALNSKGTVIVYEPNIEIMAATMQIAELKTELGRKNVFVYSDFELFKKSFAKNYKYNSNVSILFLPSYKKLFDKNLSDFAERLNLLAGTLIMNNNYIKHRMYPAVKSVCLNMDLLVKEPPLSEYKDLYKGQTAVIVSAGPTLDRDAEVLKKYKDRAIILAVGQAAKTLQKTGITPDFTGLIEVANQMSQLDGLDISDMSLILEPQTFSGLHKKEFKHIISYPSHNSVANLIWTEIANIDATPYFSSGTVSYMMLFAAKILGFKDIILVGQDLAYIDGNCYTKGSCQVGLKYEKDENTGDIKVVAEDFEKFKNSFVGENSNLTEEQKINYAKGRLNSVNKNLYFVKGINGEDLPSTKDYASFIVEFSDFAKKYGESLNLYNSSLKGAEIDGFKNVPLEDLLKNKDTIERKSLNVEYKYDINSIINNIRHENATLKDIIKMLNTAKSLTDNYDKEYNNRKVISDNCAKIFKQLVMMYIDITKIFCPKSRIFSYLQKIYALDLEDSMRNNSEDAIKSISVTYKYLKIYMLSLLKNLNEISDILKTKADNLNEMLNTKS